LQPNSVPSGRRANLLAMMHLPSCLMMGFAVVLGETVASRIVTAQAALWGFMTGFLLMGAYMVLSDNDQASITSNQASRTAPTHAAIPFAIVLASLGLLSATYLGLSALIVALVSTLIMMTYHAGVKENRLLGNVFIGTNTAITFIFAGFAVGNLTWPLAIFASMAFFVSMGRETAKGLNDSFSGAQSEAVSVEIAETGKQTALLFFAAVVLSIMPLILGLVSDYYIPLVLICDIGFLLTAYSMITSPTPRNAKRNEKYVLLWLSFGLLAFVMGTI
jgi:geranylgeranylglycerol-phosphate geranylgeranyltransferase